jgi:2-haloacid dehalogenase
MGRERWASFDCYGTLVDWESGIGSVLGRLWPDLDREALLTAYHDIEPRVQAGRSIPYREVMARSLESLADREGVPLRPGDERALAESLPAWPVFPEVPTSLAALKDRGWSLAILSNTDPDLLAASLESIGVQPDLTITAADAGSYKPAHGHWKRFRERSDVHPARHVHVAASLFHDVAPAAALGIPAVWINRKGEESDLPRAAELPDLRDLPRALDALVPAD